MRQKCVYWLLPLAGVIFCLWYVRAAACDVVYSDYIRLVNSYLPDVWNPNKFFVPDVLTRIPINYLERIVNVSFFGFSLTFDRVLGVLGLGGSALVLGVYSGKRRLGIFWYGILMVLLFGLNQWEMLINGSGWAHFLAFACFYYHYLVLDRVWEGEARRGDCLRLVLLPLVITLGVAGPYCAIYLVTLCLAYGFCMWNHYRNTGEGKHGYLLYAAAAVVSVLLYIWSNSYAVEDHAGAVSESLLSAVTTKTSFFGRFFLKSFASMILGGEVALDLLERRVIPSDGVLLLMGAGVIAAYLTALWLYFRFRLYETTILPLMLLVSGGLNHVLIMLSRWIFINENYAMSSRYALQFQAGILGIVLTAGLAFQAANGRRSLEKLLALCFCLVFLSGSMYTSWREIKKAPYRKENFEKIRTAAVNYEQLSDKELAEVFEYRRNEEGSGAKIRSALDILREHRWNVFSDTD